jgi:serine/threonine protein kinase/WD40 repeat protein
MNPTDMQQTIARELGFSSRANRDDGFRKPRVPDHELLARIARGSYGEVWLARSVTGQFRAIKVVWREDFASDYPYEREFRGISRFEPISRTHPGLINILHVGRDNSAGCFFYVMELADNAAATRIGTNDELPESSTYAARTLASEIKRRRRLPVPEVLALGVALARALTHLHRHGLVHRDIKPSNVVFVKESPKLADIGLVVGKDEARSFVGTEGFIPPEGAGSEQADMFSLGRTLYQAATGLHPAEFPQLPADLDGWTQSERSVLLELNEVLARACSAEQEERHESAEELAKDLELILAGRSVRRLYWRHAVLRAVRRITVALLTLTLLACGFIQFRRDRDAEFLRFQQRESRLRSRMEATEKQLRVQSFFRLLEQARGLVRSGQVGQRPQSLEAIRQAGAISNSPALRREALAALSLADLKPARQIYTDAHCTLAELDPIFEQIAVSSGLGAVEIRTVNDGALVTTLPAQTNLPAFRATWSADRAYLAVHRSRKPDSMEVLVEVWHLDPKHLLKTFAGAPYQPVTFNPIDPAQFLTVDHGRTVLLNLETLREVRSFAEETTPRFFKFSPAGDCFAEIERKGEDYLIIGRDLHGTRQFSTILGYGILRLDWHPSGRWIAAPDVLGDVHLINARTGGHQVLGRHKSAAVNVTFSPDGEYLMSSGKDGDVICWSLSSMEAVVSLSHSSQVQFRSNSPQCAWLSDNRLQLGVLETSDFIREFKTDGFVRVRDAAFSPDGSFLAASGLKRLNVWDWRRSTDSVSIAGPENARPFFSSESSELFAYWNDAIGHWHLERNTDSDSVPTASRLPVNKARRLYSAMVCSTNLILTGQGGLESVPLRQAATGPGRVRFAPAGIGCVSADCQWLGLRTEWDPYVHIFHLPEMQEKAAITSADDVMDFAFGPPKGDLAIATRKGLELFQTRTWTRRCVLPMPMDVRARIIFSPDGESLWISNDAQTAGLYRTSDLELLVPLPQQVIPLAVSADGHYLAVSIASERLQVWDLPKIMQHFAELGIAWNSSL